MAHEVETAMFFSKPAWHGLGVVLDHAPTSSEALTQAGLDWTVAKQSIQLVDGDVIDDQFALVRQSDRRVLGVVGSTYEPVQNATAFAAVDEVLGGEVFYESAGSLRNGKTIFILAQIGETQVSSDDRLIDYLLLTNNHDGTQKVRIFPTQVRVVCQNTLNLSLRRQRGLRNPSIQLTHTKSFSQRLEEAKGSLAACKAIRERWNAQVAAMAQTKMTASEENDVLDRAVDIIMARGITETIIDRHAAQANGSYLDAMLAETTLTDQKKAERARIKRDGILTTILQNLDRERDLGGDSAWSLFNAIGSFADHQMHGERTSAEGHFASQLLPNGTAANVKSQVLDLILEKASIQ